MTRTGGRFTLRYAAHLGFRSFDQPLFAYLARSREPEDQIRLAADEGFAGMQDPWFSNRATEKKDAIAAGLAATGLTVGTLVIGARADLARPLWLPETAEDALHLDAAVARALADAALLRTAELVAVPAARAGQPVAMQEARLVDRLCAAADMAAAQGARISVEAIGPATVPGLLLTSFAQAARVVRAADHPAVRLVFDTGHLLATDGDLPGNLARHRDIIGPVQIAGQPGRCEPGASEADLVPVLLDLARHGHDGLVELEHLWRDEGAASERAGLRWLDTLEPALRQVWPKGNGT